MASVGFDVGEVIRDVPASAVLESSQSSSPVKPIARKY